MGWVEEGVGRCGGGVMEGRGLGIRIGGGWGEEGFGDEVWGGGGVGGVG